MAKKNGSNVKAAAEKVYNREAILRQHEEVLAAQGAYERSLRILEKELGHDMDSDMSDVLDTHDVDTLIAWAKEQDIDGQ